jgi:hypothetical protein
VSAKLFNYLEKVSHRPSVTYPGLALPPRKALTAYCIFTIMPGVLSNKTLAENKINILWSVSKQNETIVM